MRYTVNFTEDRKSLCMTQAGAYMSRPKYLNA